MKKQILSEEFKRMQKLAGFQLNENEQMLQEINGKNDFSDIDMDMGKDKEAFMNSVEGIIEDLYNQGGYRDIFFIKEYLKHLIDIS